MAVITRELAAPRFSLVVPTYQRPHLLGRALASARAQSFEDFELLVVDDGAEAATRTALETAAEGDPRIRYLSHAQRQGVAAARNTGIEAASGAWVVFLDDDDELMPSMLERVAQRLDTAPGPLGFLWCGIQIVRDTGSGSEPLSQRLWGAHLERLPPYPADRARRELDAVRIGCGFGLSVRRDLLDTLGGFDPSLVIAEETDLVLRLLAHEADFVALGDPLVVVHRVEGKSLSSTTPAPQRVASVKRLVERNRPLLDARPHLASKLWDTLGREYYRAGDPAGAWRIARFMLRRYPTHRLTWRMLGRALATRRRPPA